MEQLDLFADEDLHPNVVKKEDQWMACWGWSGPEVGKYISLDWCFAERESDGETGYYYMAPCRVLEKLPEDKWRCIIDYAGAYGKDYHFQTPDGIVLIIPKEHIWFPVYVPDRGGYPDLRDKIKFF